MKNTQRTYTEQGEAENRYYPISAVTIWNVQYVDFNRQVKWRTRLNITYLLAAPYYRDAFYLALKIHGELHYTATKFWRLAQYYGWGITRRY